MMRNFKYSLTNNGSKTLFITNFKTYKMQVTKLKRLSLHEIYKK